MNTNEMKRILNENCAELARILDDCRSGPAENVRVVEVMEPMLREIQELREQIFGDLEQNKSGDRHE